MEKTCETRRIITEGTIMKFTTMKITKKVLAGIILSVLVVLGAFYTLKPSPLPKIYIPSDIEWQTPALDAYIGDFTPVWDKEYPDELRTVLSSEYTIRKTRLDKDWQSAFSGKTSAHILTEIQSTTLCTRLLNLSNRVANEREIKEHTAQNITRFGVIDYYFPGTVLAIEYKDGCVLSAMIDKDTGKYIRLRVNSEKTTEHNWEPSKIYVKLMYN